MAHRVLGLDIGSYSIKAAVFETTFRSFQITDLYESRPLHIDELSKEESHKAQSKALARFITDNAIPIEMVIGSLSGSKVSHRKMTLPFKDRKQIEKVLPFELENFLPFEIEDLVVDFDITKRQKNQTTLQAYAVKKEFLRQYLDLYESVGCDPKIIDVDVLALGNVAHVSNLPIEGECVILDIGHQKTSLSILSDGKAVAVRTFFNGGHAITDALRREFDLTYQQAEEVKHKYAAVDPGEVTGSENRQEKIVKCISEVLQPLIVDIGQTIQNYESSSESDTKIETIFLCGGSSLVRGIDRLITETTGRNVDWVHCIQDESRLETKIGKKEAVMIQAISLGLRTGIRGVALDRLSATNFRKGEFAVVKSYTALKEKTRFYGIWAAVFVGLLILQFVVSYGLRSKQVDTVRRGIIQNIEKTVPDFPKGRVKTPKQALNIMQTRIRDFQDKVDLLTSGLKSITALDILREVSSRIPKSIVIDVTEISIDRNKVFIKGDTDSFTSVDKIVSFLSKYEKFQKVDKGAISDAPNSAKKRFTINIVVGDKEEAG